MSTTSTQQSTAPVNNEIGRVVWAPKCHHIEAEAKLTNRSWNRYHWCADCRRWFWWGDKDHSNAS